MFVNDKGEWFEPTREQIITRAVERWREKVHDQLQLAEYGLRNTTMQLDVAQSEVDHLRRFLSELDAILEGVGVSGEASEKRGGVQSNEPT